MVHSHEAGAATQTQISNTIDINCLYTYCVKVNLNKLVILCIVVRCENVLVLLSIVGNFYKTNRRVKGVGYTKI